MLIASVLMLTTGCDSAANLLDEAQMQADLLMYGDEAKEYYAETLDGRDTFKEKEPELLKLFDEARAQTAQNDRTQLDDPVTWKFLWLNCHQVEYMGDTYEISEKQASYSKDAAESFVQLLEDAGGGNINVECDIVDIEYMMHASLSKNGDSETKTPSLTFEDTDKERDEYGIPGNYDVILFITPLLSALTQYAGRCSADITMGFGYMNVLLPPDEQIDNEYAERYPVLQTSTVALHELIHALEGYNAMLGMEIVPNPDKAPKYSGHKVYTGDASLESFVFYDDILRGSVKMSDGRLLGIYPTMWRISPRYLTEICAVEYLQKSAN